MTIVDLVDIGVETQMRDSGRSLEKNFIKFIWMNPLMLLYLILN